MREHGSASTSGPEEAVALFSVAWLRHGPRGMFGRVEPGYLIAYESGRVSFVTPDGTVFNADRAELGVNWPWWEFGAGVHLTVSGQVYRLSLTRPPNAFDADPTGVAEVRSIRGALDSGVAWRKYLSPPG